MLSKGGEFVQEQNVDLIVFGLFKWVWSIVIKFVVDQVIEVDEFLLYSFYFGFFVKWILLVGVFFIVEVENFFDVFIKGLFDFLRFVVKVVQNKV